MPTVAQSAAALASTVASLSLKSKNNKTNLETFDGKSCTKEMWLTYAVVNFTAENVDQADWAGKAAARLEPTILHLFLSTDIEAEDLKTMTWEAFKSRFLALSVGPAEVTDLARTQALLAMAYSPDCIDTVAATVNKAEAIINRMLVQPTDPSKIAYIINAIHPALRPRVSYAPDGKDYLSYTAFRQNLLAQAIIFEAAGPSHQDRLRRVALLEGHNKNSTFYKRFIRKHGNKFGNHNKKGNKSFTPGSNHKPFKKPHNTNMATIKCHACQQFGHYAKHCPQVNVVASLCTMLTDTMLTDTHAVNANDVHGAQVYVEKPKPKDTTYDFSPHMTHEQQNAWLLARLNALRGTPPAQPRSISPCSGNYVYTEEALLAPALITGSLSEIRSVAAATTEEGLIQALMDFDSRHDRVTPTPPALRERRPADSSRRMVTDSSVADGDGLMFNPELFSAVQTKLLTPCTVDICVDRSVTLPMLEACNSFLSSDWQQSHAMLWLCPPREERELYLQRYAAAKVKDPTIGAIIMLPAKYQSPITKRMPILDRFSRGTPVFVDIANNGPVKAKCDFILYVDKPVKPESTLAKPPDTSPTEPQTTVTTTDRPTTSHVMQQLGSVAGSPAQILIDTGAEGHNYLSHNFCQRIGLKPTPVKDTISVQGVQDSTGVVHGTCTAVMTLQSLKLSIQFLVIDMPNAFDVILGDVWLRQTQATLDYDTRTCVVRKGKHRYILQMQQDASKPSSNATLAPILAYSAAKRALSKPGTWHYLMLVKETEASNTTTEDTKVQELKSEYPQVFTDHPPHGGSKIQIGYEVIPVPTDSNPVLRPMYRYSPIEMEEMDKQIKALLELGYIRPSQSPYGAPVLFVKKPRSTELRMVIDYRALNKLTKRNAYPLPRIDDMLDHLAGATTFSLIDLRQAYHQCRLVESDIPKTAFRTPLGHYEYITLSFGLTNAPAAFQSVMNRLFTKHMYKFVMIYLDDILIFSENEAEHATHLRMVLDILKASNLTVAINKCKFYQKEVLFLGHIVSGEGVKVDPAKVQAVTAFPRPANVYDLRSFLGMATYFRRFINRFAKVAYPLTELLKQTLRWEWTEACETAFLKLKELLTSAPVLALPDWRSAQPFELICDASLQGIGGVLMQNKHPIAFESRKLKPAELNYSATELEMLAVVYCIEKWRCYVEGREIQVYTDHKPNTYFDTTNMQSRRAAKWLEKLQQYKLQWNYKPGSQNVVADALSRHPAITRPVVAFATLRFVSTLAKLMDSRSFTEGVQQGYDKDINFQDKQFIAELQLKQSLWYTKDGLLVIPDDIDVKTLIMTECHDTPYAGHVGRTKTLHNIRKNFWWPRMFADVRRFIASCDSCQRVKPTNQTPVGLLQPLPVPGDTWDSVSMDLIVSLPQTSAGFTAIAVFVDRLSKMTHLAPCRDDTSAETLAEIFVQNVFKLHGLPSQIVSDRDPRFTGKFWRALMQRLEVSQAMSSAFHPQTDGNTERVNRVLEDMLRHYIDPAQSTWDSLLPLVEFAINDSYHESVRNTPFVLNFGKRPRLPVDLALRGEEAQSQVTNATCDSAVALVDRIHRVVAEAKKCLEAAQQRQKAYADQHRRDVDFAVGTEVLLNTKHIKINMKGSSKLLPRWVGPFKVTEKINPVAYKLELPPNLKIHPVFHASLLKAYVPGRVDPPPPPEIVDEEFEWEVESVLAHRDVQVSRKKNRQRTPILKRQYLVKWKGYDASNNTWEPEQHCANCPEKIAEYWARHADGVASNKRPTPVQRTRKRRRSARCSYLGTSYTL